MSINAVVAFDPVSLCPQWPDNINKAGKTMLLGSVNGTITFKKRPDETVDRYTAPKGTCVSLEVWASTAPDARLLNHTQPGVQIQTEQICLWATKYEVCGVDYSSIHSSPNIQKTDTFLDTFTAKIDESDQYKWFRWMNQRACN